LADELKTAALHQYLGLRPERLQPVQVGVCGALVWVNLNIDPVPLDIAEGPLQQWLADSGSWSRVGVSWREMECNWKLLAQHLLSLEEPGDESSLILQGKSGTAEVAWCFPNLLLLRNASTLCILILQPVGLGKTLCRLQVFSSNTLAAVDADQQLQAWMTLIAEREQAAVTHSMALMRWDHPARVADPSARYPRQNDRAGLWAQQQLIQRVTQPIPFNHELKLFSPVRNYLI
jgi:hypothetical protein